MDLLIKEELFGKLRCHIFDRIAETRLKTCKYYQILMWLENIISPDMIDILVCTEILDPLLYAIANTNMMHGPCGF